MAVSFIYYMDLYSKLKVTTWKFLRCWSVLPILPSPQAVSPLGSGRLS